MVIAVRKRVYRIIFEADTPSGKLFDVALLVAIVASVVVVMLDSVQAIRVEYSGLLYVLEWVVVGTPGFLGLTLPAARQGDDEGYRHRSRRRSGRSAGI